LLPIASRQRRPHDFQNEFIPLDSLTNLPGGNRPHFPPIATTRIVG
jgi:hypothetical protein